MGGLVVINWYGQEMNFEIGVKPYKVPSSGGQVIIYLPPGKQNYSANILGLGQAGGTVDIIEGRYVSQPWAAQ